MEWNYLTISLFHFDYLNDEDGKKVDTNNEDKDEKIWKNDLIFELFILKLSYMTIFRKIWEKNYLPNF